MDETLDGLPDEILDRLPIGVQVVDQTGLTVRVNHAFLRIFGCDHDNQVVGIVNALTNPLMREHGITPYVQRALRGEAVQTPVAVFHSPMGPARDLRADIVPLRDKDGAVSGATLFIEDLTQQQTSARALERRYRQIETLGASFQRIGAILNTDAVLTSVLEAMRRLDLAESCGVWYVDARGRWNCVASYGLSAEYQRVVEAVYAKPPDSSHLPGAILLANRPVTISDSRVDAMNEEIRSAMMREGIRRMVITPMQIGETVIGALSFHGREPGHADPIDVQTAALLSDQAAVAIQNASHYERARDAALEAQALNRIAAVLADRTDLAEVLNKVTETAAQLMDVSRVIVWSINAETHSGRLLAHTGLRDDFRHVLESEGPAPFILQHPLLHQMMATAEPVVIQAVDTEALAPLDPARREVVRALDIRSLLIVPMCEEGRVVGMVTFDEPGDPHTWSERDIRLAQGLATQTAVAIRNARLADEARVMREWLEDKVEERTAELRTAHAEVMATEKLAAVGFMAREVAHGLRNPLNVISTSLYFLRSRFKEADEKVERHFGTIARSVEQAANIINQLMNLAGSRQPNLAPVDLNQLVQRALEERRAVGDFQAVVQWDTTLPMVRGDWTQISHAVKALIGFAAGSGRVVHIHTLQEDGCAVVAVGDDRPPLTDEEREALFQPFAASATEWTGLGLSVARQIARKHGGDVELAEAGGHTWVRLHLPLASAVA